MSALMDVLAWVVVAACFTGWIWLGWLGDLLVMLDLCDQDRH